MLILKAINSFHPSEIGLKNRLNQEIDFQNCHFDYSNEFFNGCYREIHLGSIIVNRFSMNLPQNCVLNFEVKSDCIVLCFSIFGNVEIKSNSFNGFGFSDGSHNIIHSTALQAKLLANKGKNEFFLMQMPLEEFRVFFPKSNQEFETFNQQMHQGKFSKLRSENGIVSQEMYQIIQSICKCEREESIKEIYIKAKVLELISLQLEQLCTLCKHQNCLKNQEAEKMYAVRDFMLTHLSENHTLEGLAQEVNTNVATLKKEFKSLFGSPVFCYWNDLKMEKAQQMLIEKELNIKQISSVIGYKNPQHFTTAFKRKFGKSPSQYLKSFTNK